MNIVTVVKKGTPLNPHKRRFYIGRPSALGNPFMIGQDGSREEVVTAYRHWITKQMHIKDSAAGKMLRSLITHGFSVGEFEVECYCAPLACHGDVIKEIVDKEVDDIKTEYYEWLNEQP